MKPLNILHEGKRNNADHKLIELLINSLQFDLSHVEFHAMGVKSNFFDDKYSTYKDLKQNLEGEVVKKLLFIVDADYIENDKRYGGFLNTKNALVEVINVLGFQDISDIFIMCDPNAQTGYLESLILSTIPVEQKSCIEAFLACSNFSSKENHKAILNQIYKMAYPNAPYDFEHTNFDLLKTKIRKLFSVY